jgi:flagellar FliJ protein
VKSADALIRIAKHQIDLVRRRLAAVETQLSETNARLAGLDSEEMRERAFCLANPDMTTSLSRFLQGAALRRASLAASRAALLEQMRALHLDLQHAFEEQKKIELLEEKRKLRVRQEQARIETATLDEVAGRRRRT